ncbi:MAG: hypothetical protein ACR2KL_03795 [Nocardioidaceae bacterium]
MSTVARPSGPLPPRVYWTRRLLLLALTLLVLWGLSRCAAGGGSSPVDNGASPIGATVPPGTPASTPISTPTSTGPPAQSQKHHGHQSTTTRSSRVRSVRTRLEAPSGRCDLTTVGVHPSVTPPSYTGQSVTVHLQLSTKGSRACTLPVDADHLLISVTTSDGSAVWSSTHCPDAVPQRSVVLRPHWQAGLDVVWSGLRTANSCATDASPAGPGRYLLQTAVLTGEPTSTSLELLDPNASSGAKSPHAASSGATDGPRP